MSMSGTYRSNWQQRVSAPQQTGPDRRDLRLQDSRGVQARMVAASSGILRAAKYLIPRPIAIITAMAKTKWSAKSPNTTTCRVQAMRPKTML